MSVGCPLSDKGAHTHTGARMSDIQVTNVFQLRWSKKVAASYPIPNMAAGNTLTVAIRYGSEYPPE